MSKPRPTPREVFWFFIADARGRMCRVPNVDLIRTVPPSDWGMACGEPDWVPPADLWTQVRDAVMADDDSRESDGLARRAPLLREYADAQTRQVVGR